MSADCCGNVRLEPSNEFILCALSNSFVRISFWNVQSRYHPKRTEAVLRVHVPLIVHPVGLQLLEPSPIHFHLQWQWTLPYCEASHLSRGAKRGVVRARRLGMIVAFNITDFVMVKVEPASKPSAANVPGKWDDVCCFKHPNVTRWW